MKETIRTFSTRDNANTFSTKKKILKLIQLEKRQWREGLESPWKGDKGLADEREEERFIQTQIRVQGGWERGFRGLPSWA